MFGNNFGRRFVPAEYIPASLLSTLRDYRMGDTSNLGAAVSAHAHTHGKKYFGMTIGCIVLIVILVIVIIVLAMGDSFKSRFSNLRTGSNNPLWWHGMGDAGWGGSMHSTYQDGQSRVYGVSAEGGNDLVAKTHPSQACGGLSSPGAAAEARAQGVLSGSAKNMSDDQLVRVMSGGSAV